MLAKQGGSGVLICLLITGAFLALIVDSERLVSVCKLQPYKTVLLNKNQQDRFVIYPVPLEAYRSIPVTELSPNDVWCQTQDIYTATGRTPL